MAIVKSLVCWGGSAGLTATMTIASPCVVTINNHGIRQYNGGTTAMTKGLVFSTTGALPTGITAGTTYWARYVSVNTFHLYDTEAHALDTANTTGRINTTGSQSGTHTAKSAWWLGLSETEKAVYGTAGSERAYASIAAWQTARASVTTYSTVELLEIREAFTSYVTSSIALTLSCAVQRITTSVDGVPSAAYHNGVYLSGFIIESTVTYAGTIAIDGINYREVDGLTIYNAQYAASAITSFGNGCVLSNCFIIGASAGDSHGLWLAGTSNTIFNNIIQGFTYGFRVTDYSGVLTRIFNNLVIKNTTGFYRGYDAGIEGYYYNNISIGNTTNWNALPAATSDARNNGGLSGQPWDTGGGSSRVVIATSNFVDYANNDYRPAASNSPQVIAGFNVYNAYQYDIKRVERPSWYEVTAGNWGQHTSWSVGPFEYDFGTPPALVNIVLQNVKDGSRYWVYDQTNNALISSGLQSGTSDITISNVNYTAPATLIIRVRKGGGGASDYKPFETLATLTASGATVYISQVPDDLTT